VDHGRCSDRRGDLGRFELVRFGPPGRDDAGRG
jgi:hypothetical protein